MMDDETVPKKYLNSPDSQTEQELPSSEADIAECVEELRRPENSEIMTRRLTPLDQLIPDCTDSAAKMELILQVREQLFDGRYDAASVCALLATLCEADLRSLREQLYIRLPELVPSSAGRPLTRRKAGSSGCLVEDCWALGSSVAQGMLTRFADMQTLRAAERGTPSESGIFSAPPATSDLTAVRSSIEALLAVQLRLEKEVETLRKHNRRQDAQLAEMARELEMMRDGVAAAAPASIATDGQILSPAANTFQHSPAAAAAVTARPPLPPPGRTGATDGQPPVRDDFTAENERSGATSIDRPVAQQKALARDIATSLDLQSLGMAIAAAMEARAGHSESEVDGDPWPAPGRPARAVHRQPSSTRRAGMSSASATSSNAGVGGPARAAVLQKSQIHLARNVGRPSAEVDRPSLITGTGAPSGLVATSADPGERPTRASYVLEGIAPDATDNQVRAMVSPLVQGLHELRRLKRHSGAASGLKAFKIQVDAADHPWIMNPANWPAGLRVCPWTVKQKHGRFQSDYAARHQEQQCSSRSRDHNQRYDRGSTSSRTWFNRRTHQ